MGENKLNKVWKSIKNFFKKIGIWAVDNYKLAIPAAVCVVLVITVVIVILSGRGGSTTDVAAETPEVFTVNITKDEYPIVNDLVNRYYKAVADGDVSTIEELRSYTDETEKVRLTKKAEYIESYNNIACYTQKGVVDGTYLVYVYYDIKFNDIETQVPGLQTFYLVPDKDEDGNLKIYYDDIDEETVACFETVSKHADVRDLIGKVEVKFAEALDQDQVLADFLTEFPLKLKTEIGEAIAAIETPPENTEEQTPETPAEEPIAENSPVPEVTLETVKTKEAVNVRSSDSETATKLGKAAPNTTYTRLELLPNGWSKIDYSGTEAYIKSEFLEVVGTTNASAGASAGGKVTVKETINIRKEPNETADKWGAAYKGEQFELVEKRADGWSEIKYNGNKAYVKSEYVE